MSIFNTGDSGVFVASNCWVRIETWISDRYPQLIEQLNGPCVTEALPRFESRVGRRLPEAFKESYRRHDGQPAESLGVIAGMQMLPLDSVYRHWSFWADVAEKQTPAEAAFVDGPCASARPGKVK